VSGAELTALVTCDLGAIVRGRSVFTSELSEYLAAGVGWVPANHALTPLGGLAEPNPFGSTGDLRLLPDGDTHATVGAGPGETPLELLLCDIVETDGSPWECCPRVFLARALAALESEVGAELWTSFEHEFQLISDQPAALPFSLEAQRRAEPFASNLMGALLEAGTEPERFLAEFAPHQFEVPVAAAAGIAGPDRAVIVREVVREVARRQGLRASFVPLLDLAAAGNGVHIHMSLRDESGRALLHDPSRPAALSELGGSFAAGVLAHAGALTALCAPSPVSAERLRPHHWSAGAACLAQGNREALLRIPPIVSLAGEQEAGQMRLEYRGADAAANPYLALGAIIRAGLEGIRSGLPCPPILEVDPATLSQEDAERFGIGGLPATPGETLAALEDDSTARGWLGPLLSEAYLSVKRAESAATADLSLEEACARYAGIY
jgi:glutamine synthetase